jgi:hypothetical protein
MIPKSGNRFSDKIMRNEYWEWNLMAWNREQMAERAAGA